MHLQPTPDLQNRITASNTPLPIEHLPNPHSTASRARRKSLQDNLAASNASESSPSNTQTLKITGIITSEQGVSTSKVLAPDPPSAEDASIARSWVYMMEMENIPTGSTLSEGLTPDYRMVRCQARSIDWLELIGSEVKVRSQVLDKKNKDIVWSSCDKNCQFLATAHLGKGVMLWERNGNLQIFNEERRADFNHEGSQRLAISPEGHWLARILTDRYETKLWDGIWDIKTRAFRQIDWLPDLSVDDHRRYLSNIEFSPDEQFVAVALMVPRSGKTLIEIRYTATTEVHWATEVDLRIFYRRATIKFSHDGCYLAVKGSHSYGAVILLEVPSKLVTQRFELDGSHQCFGEPYFSTDDRFIFWHQTNFLFVVWEWATGRSRRVEFVEATGDESIQPRLGRSVHAFWDHPDLSFLPNNSLVMLFSEKVFKTINTEGFEPIFDTGLLRSRMPIPAVPGEEYRLRPGLKVYTLERKNKGLYGFFGNIFGGS
ncbi:hypothetical protein BCR34DRAFT_121624 [Clohesyomyces aquaticus]|uniref:WD40-repeat-containing domain protein n=1 Tax=Clohesyomyces aquaticus TaxID=1231657 RepID=A0A1Y1YPQ2_9PLEO|nr:hypothetical protein BCR34DRAFT_121624 [Clohesyomyces aquaticus]